jgi:hypothetical protein
MSVSLLVKFLISFPKLAEAFRGVMDAYEERLYMERHNNMRGAIDEWMHSDSSSDKAPLLFRETGPTKLHPNPETDGGGDVTLHKRLREQCPISAKDCPFASGYTAP